MANSAIDTSEGSIRNSWKKSLENDESFPETEIFDNLREEGEVIRQELPNAMLDIDIAGSLVSPVLKLQEDGRTITIELVKSQERLEEKLREMGVFDVLDKEGFSKMYRRGFARPYANGNMYVCFVRKDENVAVIPKGAVIEVPNLVYLIDHRKNRGYKLKPKREATFPQPGSYGREATGKMSLYVVREKPGDDDSMETRLDTRIVRAKDKSE